MDFYEIQKHRTTVNRQPSRHKGKRLTEDQVRLLEKSFSSDKKLDPERKLQLAVELGVPPRQVAIWYQNKKARWKTQTLELEYNTLQVKLDSAMAEKRELESDVERLRAELRKAREMMALAGLTHQAQEPSNNNNNCNNNNNNSNSNSNSNVIISCRSNNVVSGSSEEAGWSTSASNNSFNEDDRRQLQVGCCWEEGEENIKALHLDDLFACVMFANGPARSDD